MTLPRPYYEHAGITIYHGDCREILPQLGMFDAEVIPSTASLLLTDPPYGIGADRNLRANKQHGRAVTPSKDYGLSSWDSKPPSRWLIEQMIEMSDWQIIFGGNFFGLPAAKCWLVWDKDNEDNGYADCELAWTNLHKSVRRIRWRWMGMLQEDMSRKEFRDHPTQKPVPVMRWAIQQAPEDCAVVLDPFMGSGSTLVAAKNLGRCAIGIEIEERYCEIAAKRLSQEVLKFEAPLIEHVPEQMELIA